MLEINKLFIYTDYVGGYYELEFMGVARVLSCYSSAKRLFPVWNGYE